MTPFEELLEFMQAICIGHGITLLPEEERMFQDTMGRLFRELHPDAPIFDLRASDLDSDPGPEEPLQ